MNPLEQLRYDAGLTQKELARRSGVSLRSICRIESAGGKPTAPITRRLAETLGIAPSDLAQRLTCSTPSEEQAA